MNIVFFAHPQFITHQSMPRFLRMLNEGMKTRGHQTRIWNPKARFYRVPMLRKLKKWLGYVDQYIIFPFEIFIWIKKEKRDTLFVFTDQALGPWIPFVANRPHVIHCHDFLAQRSALNKIPQNRVGFTGKQYQAIIRKGYSKGKNFISVSNRTREDLHSFLPAIAGLSAVVYNGLNQAFSRKEVIQTRIYLSRFTGVELTEGYLLHVGGNQWYKNRRGVLEIYDAWRTGSNSKIPLLLIGEKPDSELQQVQNRSLFHKDIYFLEQVPDDLVRAAYAGATVFLFPSLAEGFGWPIAEAMASGCPVITTDAAPMTEVGMEAGFYIPKRPAIKSEIKDWTAKAAEKVEEVISLSPEERQEVIKKGLLNSQRFDPENALDKIEKIYLDILKKEEVL